MSFNRRESGEWAQGVEAAADKLQVSVDKALADGAARGFPAPPGETLGLILAMGQETKEQLVQGNGKIYDARRAVLFSEDEFAMKVVVKLATLGMELYREELFNALSLEQAEVQALMQRGQADIRRLNAETEARQGAIIRDHAAAQEQIASLKEQLVAAQAATLPYETLLVKAQLAAAEKKLEIIDSIYQVVAAEQLELVAEQRRLAALQDLLAAQQVLVAIKREMVPFYVEKAHAEEDLAAAITQEIPIKEALIRLGYDQLDLKTAGEYVGHLERDAQEQVELARAALTRATVTTRFLQTQSREFLLAYTNKIQKEILAKKLDLEKEETKYQLDTRLSRETILVKDSVQLKTREIANLNAELASLIQNIGSRGGDEAGKVSASGNTSAFHRVNTEFFRTIRSGSIA